MGASLGTRATRRTPVSVRVTRAGVAAGAAVALMFAFYAWTATSSGNPFNKVNPFGVSSGGVDYYNLQADAFLHGRLWVDVPIDPRMLTAENPYTLAVPQNVQGLVDGSFYKGHYYLAWGPAPAVTTFLPPRLVGLRVQENLAVTIYAFFGVLFAAMTLTLLVRRLVPDTPRAVIWAGNATLALATSIPWQLRTPVIYEAAITAAFFFIMAGLLVLVRELLRDEAPRRGRLAAAGTLFGLALLSRPTMLFVVVGLTALAWLLRPEARRMVTPWILGLPAIAGVIFMIYNAARFSGPLDFGNQWQTTGNDLHTFPFNDIANLPPALYGYLVAPLHLTVGFPYIHFAPPPNAPFAANPKYQSEPTGSLVCAVPFVLLALAFLARRRRTAADGGSDDTSLVRPVVLVLLAIAAVVLLAGIYGVPGYTERYKLDFVPWIVIAATLGWAALIRHASSARRAAWWRRGGIALAAWGALVGIAVSFTGYFDSFNTYNRHRFQSLERAFSPLPTLATQIAGRPMIAGVLTPPYNITSAGGYTTPDLPDPSVELAPEEAAELTIVSPDERAARLTFGMATKVPGTFTVYQSRDGETTTSVDVHGGAVGTLPLRLRRGLNYVAVGLTAGADVAQDPDGAPVIVRLRDIRLK